ncbi:hypothetical protein HPB50_024442 [Hyalomma asiaticum]|uniref:Uncharacterized protein n=1 Tax=Hyalomma asiaticum TaxID=266040 RepID=A0ACB7SQP1_HYAAI|nr:hypothetical protein HPB50_024442 [Hyalomma asiaticum]
MPGPEIEKMTTRCCGQRASRPDMALVKAAVGVLAGLFLALSGLATYVFFPAILKTQVELNDIEAAKNEGAVKVTVEVFHRLSGYRRCRNSP